MNFGSYRLFLFIADIDIIRLGVRGKELES